MAKILTDLELGDIIHRATTNPAVIEDSDNYAHFLEDLAELIAAHFGGNVGRVSEPDGDLGWTVGLHVNVCVPDDGGVYSAYDTDVTWKDGEELETPERT